jgi:hypothetical protein
LTSAKSSFGGNNIYKAHYGTREAVFRADGMIRKAYNSGEFQTFYLDQIRGERDAKDALSMVESVMVGWWDNYKHSARFGYNIRKTKTGIYVDRISLNINDFVDLNKNVEICYIDLDKQKYCLDVRENFKKASVPDISSSSFDDIKILEMKERRVLCAVSLSYTDDRGVAFHLGAEQLNRKSAGAN